MTRVFLLFLVCLNLRFGYFQIKIPHSQSHQKVSKIATSAYLACISCRPRLGHEWTNLLRVQALQKNVSLVCRCVSAWFGGISVTLQTKFTKANAKRTITVLTSAHKRSVHALDPAPCQLVVNLRV